VTIHGKEKMVVFVACSSQLPHLTFHGKGPGSLRKGKINEVGRKKLQELHHQKMDMPVNFKKIKHKECLK
jgi:hypothetical protein